MGFKLPILSEVLAKIRERVGNGGYLDENDFDFSGLGFAMGATEIFAKDGCQKNINTELCSLKAKAVSQGKEFDSLLNKSEKNRKASVGDSWQKELCPTHFEIKYAEKRIAREKEIGKTSGFVDGSKLHELGSQIFNQKKQLAPYEANYKKKNGKSFDYSNCPDKFDGWKGVQD